MSGRRRLARRTRAALRQWRATLPTVIPAGFACPRRAAACPFAAAAACAPGRAVQLRLA